MIEEAITREESFSVMYTPFVKKIKVDKTDKIKDTFAKKHPDYVEHIYTGKRGFHMLLSTAYCLPVCGWLKRSLRESGAWVFKFLHFCGGKLTSEICCMIVHDLGNQIST